MPAGLATLTARLRHLWLLKGLGITAFMTLFFMAYFEVLHYPGAAPKAMPLTALDAAVPFQPQALIFYVSLWIYTCIAPSTRASLRELTLFGLWIGAMCASALLIFVLWPTTVPALPPQAAHYPAFALLQGLDVAGNACPSLHVASAVFAACWNARLLRELALGACWQVANAAWLLLIVWSTLAIKQHVLLDVLAGALLGGVFAAASLRAMPRPER